MAESVNLRWTSRYPQNTVQSYRITYGDSSLSYGKVLTTSEPQINLTGVPTNRALKFTIATNLVTGGSVIETPSTIVVVPDSDNETFTDTDSDGLADGIDNCLSVSNPSQLDADGDGIGDACDGINAPTPSPTVVLAPTGAPTVTPTWTATPMPTVFPIVPTPTIAPQLPSLPLDSDNDGVPDAVELQKGTDPYDKGSKLEDLSTEFCGEWNGFIAYNFAELRNVSSKDLGIVARLYDGMGIVKGQTYFAVAPGAQFDLAVHEMSGFQRNAYGRVCFQHNGSAGDIDGQVSIYQPNSNNSAFQFAYSSSFENGKMGEVVLPLNTFNPNVGVKNGNFVANWVQVTNLSGESQSGTLYMHAQNGQILNQIRVVLEAGQRQDFSAHQFGRMVGLIRWTPDNSSVRFLTRVVRYLCDNKEARFSFDTAAQINGMVGTGEDIYLPLNTKKGAAIVEVLNASNKATSASVEIRDQNGTVLGVYNLGPNVLPAYGSFHLITDNILGSGKIGTAVVRGSEKESIAAVSMMYVRGASSDIEYMYGVEGVTVPKYDLTGSYNTNIGIAPTALIQNTSGSEATLTVELTRSSGQKGGPGQAITIPAYGMVELNLRQYEIANAYGAVKINSNKKLVGFVIRERGLDFGIPTTMK